MNWNISAWSIRHPVPPVLLFVVLIVLGVMSFSSLPALMPIQQSTPHQMAEPSNVNSEKIL